MSAHTSLHIVITTRIPVSLQPQLMMFDKQIIIRDGLPVEESIQFLQQLDTNDLARLRSAPIEKLRAVVELVNGLPRALQVIYNILISDPFVSLDDILEVQHFVAHDDVIRTLIEDSYRHLDDRSRMMLDTLSVYQRPVTVTAVEYILHCYMPQVSVIEVARKLARAFVINIDPRAKTISLNPVDQTYIYSRIPAEGDYSRPALERLAADYYQAIAVAPKDWRTLMHIEPTLFEFEHRFNAGSYDDAARLVDLMEPMLLRWGYSQRLLSMRLQLAETLTDPARQQMNLGRIGKCYHSLGNYTDAIRAYLQGLEISRSLTDRTSEGSWLEGLGDAYQSQGNYDTAIAYYTQALEFVRDLPDRRNEGQLLADLGRAYRDIGDHHQGIEYLQEALAIARELDDRQNLGRSSRQPRIDLSGIGTGRSRTGLL